MSTRNPVDHHINDLMANRWSPYGFHPDRDVSNGDLEGIFEAARWAMSSYNAQPWRYIVGSKSENPDIRARIISVLAEGNQPWTLYAPVLAIGLYRPNFEHNDKPNRCAAHDLGAASAFLTVEAESRGLCVHQMAGILPDKAREAFNIPDQYEVLTALAIGYSGHPPELDADIADRDKNKRERKPRSEIVFKGSF